MGLFVEFEVTNINTMVIDLPNDYDLIENDILEDSDLPKNWQNKEEFTISDLKKQSEEYQEYVCQLAREHGSMHSTLQWLEKYTNLDKISLDIVKGTLENVTSS